MPPVKFQKVEHKVPEQHQKSCPRTLSSVSGKQEPDATEEPRAPYHTNRDANALKDDSAETAAASAP